MDRIYLNENSVWDLILALKPYLGCHMPIYRDLVYISHSLLC